MIFLGFINLLFTPQTNFRPKYIAKRVFSSRKNLCLWILKLEFRISNNTSSNAGTPETTIFGRKFRASIWTQLFGSESAANRLLRSSIDSIKKFYVVVRDTIYFTSNITNTHSDHSSRFSQFRQIYYTFVHDLYFWFILFRNSLLTPANHVYF